jgi:hypothetical protein
MPVNIPITTFNGGKMSPLIDVRIDIEKYQNGCRILENMLPRVYGPVERRPGTIFIADITDA